MTNRDPNCVFCRIVAGEIPSLKVMENEGSLAFMDIGPLADAHLLFIPKQHYVALDEMSGDAVAELARWLPQLSRVVRDVAKASGYNVLQNNGRVAGQVVEHVHFHIIPRREGDGLGYRWHAKQYEPGRAEQIQEQLVQALKNIG